MFSIPLGVTDVMSKSVEGLGTIQEYIRKDKRTELLYYVNLIRGRTNLDHHLVYKGDFFIYFMNFTLFTDSY